MPRHHVQPRRLNAMVRQQIILWPVLALMSLILALTDTSETGLSTWWVGFGLAVAGIFLVILMREQTKSEEGES